MDSRARQELEIAPQTLRATQPLRNKRLQINLVKKLSLIPNTFKAHNSSEVLFYDTTTGNGMLSTFESTKDDDKELVRRCTKPEQRTMTQRKQSIKE
ncbi:hypothetical protein KIN20_034007 [Parelaphostrongylus tenuis]|uniref:Uncharacterized protein n=1 Tax=Parelaphostrongylus tenuis TaxID=148309 RepID=A0AAD5WIQ3_PARTN|nr:hypothetical protein KIN20_034007 [Parelaphostrongylus tenuis]